MNLETLVWILAALSIGISGIGIASYMLLTRRMRETADAWIRNFELIDFEVMSSMSAAKHEALFRLERKHEMANAFVTDVVIDWRKLRRQLRKELVYPVLVSAIIGATLAPLSAMLPSAALLGAAVGTSMALCLALDSLYKSHVAHTKLQVFADKLNLQYEFWTCSIETDETISS